MYPKHQHEVILITVVVFWGAAFFSWLCFWEIQIMVLMGHQSRKHLVKYNLELWVHKMWDSFYLIRATHFIQRFIRLMKVCRRLKNTLILSDYMLVRLHLAVYNSSAIQIRVWDLLTFPRFCVNLDLGYAPVTFILNYKYQYYNMYSRGNEKVQHLHFVQPNSRNTNRYSCRNTSLLLQALLCAF